MKTGSRAPTARGANLSRRLAGALFAAVLIGLGGCAALGGGGTDSRAGPGGVGGVGGIGGTARRTPPTASK